MNEKSVTINKPGTSVLLPVLIITFVSFAVYFNTLFYDFVYDDVSQVLKNPWITDLTHIPDIFSKSVWGFLAVPSVSNHYRPLMHVIYMVSYHIFGLRPLGFHLVNVLFHAANSVMVFLVAARVLGTCPAMSGKGGETPPLHDSRSTVHPPKADPPVAGASRFFAFIAALLFATHPIHTEAVAWVGAVTDLSFTFFYLFSLYFWIRYEADGGRRAYLYSLASFPLALLCKEPAATLPLVLLAYDASLGKSRRGLAGRIKNYVPYAVIFGIYFVARYYALGGFAPVKGYRPLGSTYQYITNIIPLFSKYLELLVFPVRLNAFRILNPVASIFGTKGVISFAVVAVYAALTAVAYRKSRPAFFGLMLLVIPLLPVFYTPGLGEASLAERYLYLSSFGFVLLFAIILSWILEKTPRYGAAVIILTVFPLAAAYSVQSVKRNPVWKDNLTLFSDMVRQSPEGELPRGMLGNALMDRGKLDEAIEQYRVIITELNPNSAQAHRNLGLAFLKKGLSKEAIEEFEKAMAIAPADFEARRGLVLAYEEAGLLDEAIVQYRILVELTPGSAETHYRLAGVLSRKGITREAITHYLQALAINPDYADAHYNLGSIYADSGQIDEAVGHFEVAVRLKPDNAFYRNSLGITYGQKRLLDKAIEQFQVAVRLAPEESAYRDNLGRAEVLKKAAGKEK